MTASPPSVRRDVRDLAERRGARIRATEVDLQAELEVPHGATGVVVLAQAGAGAPAPGPDLAATLQEAGFATLRLQLLSSEETLEDEVNGGFSADAGLLARRLTAAKRWALEQEFAAAMPAGYLCSGSAAAAALIAAAAGTLLIAPQGDPVLKSHNEQALPELAAEKELRVVGGGAAAAETADAARDWFLRHLSIVT